MELANPGWYRFDRYVLANGYIRPAANARLTNYEPERISLSSGRTQAEVVRPYQALLDLLSDLEITPATKITYPILNDKQKQLILAWCGRFGLLGILPHFTEFAILAPRYQAVGDTNCRVTQQLFNRKRGKFRPANFIASVKDSFPIARAGEVLELEEWSSFQQPIAFMEHLLLGKLECEPLGRAWGCFFPDVRTEERDSYNYPIPLTIKFWRGYCEPIDEFLSAAQLLLLGLSDYSAKAAVLERLISPIGLSGDGGALHYTSPSLLATFALMAVTDLNRGYRIMNCQRSSCRRLFVADIESRAYCSLRCRWAASKARDRRRKGEAAVEKVAARSGMKETKS